MFTRHLVSSIFAFMALALPLLADNPGQGPYNTALPTDLYTSPPNGSIAIPSGGINLVPGTDTTTAVSKDAAAVPADITNLLGCGGVGQGEYTSGLYNMPESFNKFQQDANSMLSKQLLTMNFALPQTAALFDQLNNYGNQRYETFQQGCSVDALKQDAKKQYLNACVEKLTPGRKAMILQWYSTQGSKGAEGDGAPKDPQLSAIAYAQAWEVCSNQYVSDTTAVAMRTDMNQAFAKQVRDLENVTNAIKPLLCTAQSKNTVNGGTPDPNGSDTGCWQTLLIPQVRLCLDDTLGCDDSKGYSINEPLLAMPRLFDTLRFIMDDLVISRRVMDFNNQISDKSIDKSTQKLAASEASLVLSNATLGRIGDAGAAGADTSSNPTIYFGKAGTVDTRPDPSVEDFQYNYLNCKDADIMTPLKQYMLKLNLRIKPSGGTTSGGGTAGATNELKLRELKAGTGTDYEQVIKALALKDADANQLTALRMLAWTSLGCTANQSVPVFDPNLTASLQSCEAPDRYAFYSMAGYDVALASTRDIYRYLNLSLKRVYTRLLTQSLVPVAPAATPAGGTPPPAATTPPIASQELNARLARVVKEVMIPQVEAQIARLDELNATRGQFAQRVQQIYTAKSGCMYSKGTDPNKPWFSQ